MSEIVSVEPIAADVDRNYAEGSANVRTRFWIYQEATPRLDIDRFSIDVLRDSGLLTPTDTVFDAGTADGALHILLYEYFGHTGRFIGIDPNGRQFESLANPLFQVKKEDLEAWIRSGRPLPTNLRTLMKLAVGEQVEQIRPFRTTDNVEFYETRAEQLSGFKDGSIKVMFAMFMLYHMTTVERQRFYGTVKRLVDERGAFVVGTSADDNKPFERHLEHFSASLLGISPPPYMNSNFTSERASEELTENFSEWCTYRLDHRATLAIDSPQKLDTFLGGFLSMYDQYKPIPNRLDFDFVTKNFIVPNLELSVASKKNRAIEKTHRTLFVVSRHPLEEAKLQGMTRIA